MVEIKKFDGEPEDVVRLKLEQKDEGVKLIAVDKKGRWKTAGNILRIENDGKLHLQESINNDLGLELDDHGKIEIGCTY